MTKHLGIWLAQNAVSVRFPEDENTYRNGLPPILYNGMDYSKHYNKLIKRAQTRLIEGYTESHHIIPRCMGGTNNPTNLVNLTPEEHFVAHQLLTKMYPDNASLRYAANLMGNRNNKSYGWLKRGVSLNMKAANPMMNEETRKKMGESQRNKWLDPEYRKQQSEAHKGNIPSNVKWRDAPQGTAWCSEHKEYLPVEQFAKNKARKNGLLVMCKECFAKRRKGWKSRQ